ncbi:MAG: TonB-dependent receptor [Bryobacterales bacterium]|nr:TonB-dependent receptor [Bryobacterales bacterium]
MRQTLLLICIFMSASRAETVRGRVLDPSGAAVPRATVTMESRDGATRRAARADELGRYEFAAVTPASYLLRAEAQNFSPSELADVTVTADVEHDLRVELARLSARTTVTAATTVQSTDEVAKALDVIDAAEVEHRQEYTLTEALRLTPGIRIMQLGGPGSLTRIHTRGLRAFDTSVLIDGFRFRDAAAPQGDGSGFFSDLLLAGTSRVEVLRGSGSSLYGTHAMGGVVNMVTESGGAPLHGEIGADGGGLGLARGVAKLSGGTWNDRLRFSGAASHLNVTRGIDGDDRARTSMASGWAQLALSARSTLSGRVLANDTFAGINVTPFASAVSALPATIPAPAVEGRTFTTSLNDPDARRAARFTSALVNFTQQLSSTASARVYYQGLSTSRDTRNGPGGPSFQPGFNNSNIFDGRLDTVQARTDVTAGRHHQLSFGYEYEREDYDNLSADENPNVAARTRAQVLAKQASHALFAQDQMRWFSDRLLVSLSGRWQDFLLNSPEFRGGTPRYAGITLPQPPRALTGDAAIAYLLPSTGTKLRAHMGNSYRAPTLYERFGYSFFAGSFSAFGDPRIAPERSVAFDAGFDQYLASQRVRVSGTYFYTRLQEVIGFDFSGLINTATDPYGRSSGYRNTGGGLARGVELSVQAQATRTLFFQAGYTHTNADERVSTLIGGSVRSVRVSDHMFTALVTQRFARHWDATLDFFGASSYWWQMFAGGSRPFLFPGPKKADLVVNYTRPLGERRSLQWFTRIENVFNRTYYEDAFRTPKAWAVTGIKFLL